VRAFLAIAMLVAAAGVSACGEDSPPALPVAPDAGQEMAHIHGLGVNPRDGSLLVATHTGLFRAEPDARRAERIGDSRQDTMGFTVVGPDQFLGSGHPDLQEYRAGRWPPLLGLIESTDAGVTWRPVSLVGKADFHALQAAHDRIYAYDGTGGEFMVSPDGKTWETRSALAMLDFAVSPADPDVVVATTEAFPQRSRDGGRTWQPLNIPNLVNVGWPRQDELLGVAAGGEVFASGDAGSTWQRRGTLPGRPAAFVAAGILYAATHDGAIYASEDGGASWRLRYRDPT
jgi:hypothetical protein